MPYFNSLSAEVNVRYPCVASDLQAAHNSPTSGPAEAKKMSRSAARAAKRTSRRTRSSSMTSDALAAFSNLSLDSRNHRSKEECRQERFARSLAASIHRSHRSHERRVRRANGCSSSPPSSTSSDSDGLRTPSPEPTVDISCQLASMALDEVVVKPEEQDVSFPGIYHLRQCGGLADRVTHVVDDCYIFSLPRVVNDGHEDVAEQRTQAAQSSVYHYRGGVTGMAHPDRQLPGPYDDLPHLPPLYEELGLHHHLHYVEKTFRRAALNVLESSYASAARFDTDVEDGYEGDEELEDVVMITGPTTRLLPARWD